MLVLPETVRDALVDHARDGAPAEVCGVLGGEYGDTSRVETALRARNVADYPETRYAIDPGEQFDLMEAIEDDGDEVVGFYHSHPAGPATPSRTDAARATWASRSYVIVSLAGDRPRVGSWRWNADRDQFDSEPVRVVDQ